MYLTNDKYRTFIDYLNANFLSRIDNSMSEKDIYIYTQFTTPLNSERYYKECAMNLMRNIILTTDGGCYTLLNGIEVNDDKVTFYFNKKAVQTYVSRINYRGIESLPDISKETDRIVHGSLLLMQKIGLNISNGMVSIKPSELKELFKVNYTSSILVARIIEPCVQLINRKYASGEALYRCTYHSVKSKFGQGNKIVSFNFYMTDSITDWRIEHEFEQNKERIMELLAPLFSESSLRIIRFQVQNITNKEMAYYLYTELRHMNQSPDARRTTLDNVAKNILKYHYGIDYSKIPQPNEMFKVDFPADATYCSFWKRR